MTLRRFHFLFLLVACLMASLSVKGQMMEPVTFTTHFTRLSPQEVEVSFVGKIDPGWHVYSTDLPSGGPVKASLTLTAQKGIVPEGKLHSKEKPMEADDPMFGMKVKYHENNVTFLQKFKLTDKDYTISGTLEYGACNEENCLPPTQVEFHFDGHDGITNEKDQTAKTTEPANITQTKVASIPDSLSEPSQTASISSKWWQPVTAQLQAFDYHKNVHRGILVLFFLGFLGGLLALLTPCVWPIIPMTVSFFLHRSSNKREALREALLYGLSIIVIYLALGLAVTLLFGANALNALSTNAVVNIFFFLLLVVFGLSFLGGFEITLPSHWTNNVNAKAEKTSGLWSIFLMAFTLALVSFSCTGPIIGFLLVEVSTMTNILGPAIGMLGFSIALALPFSLFAMFPSFMKKLPQGGNWMNTVKVILGFLELAFSLKFLSVADLAYGWHLLDREVFIALWITLSLLLGLYLLGKLRFPNDAPSTHTSVTGFCLSLFPLAFAIYMLPGLWGAPLKAISAFAPPMSTQSFSLDRQKVEAQFTDYDKGMAYAETQGKPVLLDFTGYGCVNCRKMEMAVWNDPSVSRLIQEHFVLISLYVDDKTSLPQPIEVFENGRPTLLRTIGDRWSYLQRTKFGANAQPFYVILNNQGQPLAAPYTFSEDVEKFMHFLQNAIGQ